MSDQYYKAARVPVDIDRAYKPDRGPECHRSNMCLKQAQQFRHGHNTGIRAPGSKLGVQIGDPALVSKWDSDIRSNDSI